MHTADIARADLSTAQLAADLTPIVGADYVVTDEGSLMTYESDGATLFKATPHIVVLPDTAEQVSEVVKYANRVGAPFTARGAGTGLSGGAMALAGGIIIALNRMNRILEIDIENQRAVVEPGVVNLWITDAATPHGYHYAPDPSSQKACTIGGNVAENSGGPHTLKYGVTVNHITGLEWVLPSGEIIQLGSKAGDGVGYDIRGLVIGSEGTLGIATKIIVKLTPNPPAYKTMLAVFGSLDDASTAVSEIIGAGMIPSSLEVMDRLIIDAVEEGAVVGHRCQGLRLGPGHDGGGDHLTVTRRLVAAPVDGGLHIRRGAVDDEGEPSRTDHVTSGQSHRGRLEHDVHRRRQSYHAAHFENAKSRHGHQLALVCTKARTTSARG